MLTWDAMCRDARGAAQAIRDAHPRSSVSRSYYAAYSPVTSALVAAGVSFPAGRQNPPHANLTRYVENSLTRLSVRERRQVKNALRVLWMMRVEADYVATASVDDRTARDALRWAHAALLPLGGP